MKERVQKIISAYGIASRRAAEEMIALEQVSVNGVIARLGDTADPAIDKIIINGRPLEKLPARRCIALNKPRGYVTTASDNLKRKTVMDLLPDIGERVYPAGRLDMDSSGLIILTNDGALANKIMHPSNEKEKVYHVRVNGNVEKAVRILNSSMLIDGYRIRPAKVSVLKDDGTSVLLQFVIHEGRNRQIRKMCELVNLNILMLHRISVGEIKLGDLEPGEWRDLTEDEINSLMRS